LDKGKRKGGTTMSWVEWVLSLTFFFIFMAGLVNTNITRNLSTHQEITTQCPSAETCEVDALGPPWPWPGIYIELLRSEEGSESDEEGTDRDKKKEEDDNRDETLETK
jgi:hypothetical protein